MSRNKPSIYLKAFDQIECQSAEKSYLFQNCLVVFAVEVFYLPSVESVKECDAGNSLTIYMMPNLNAY